jgi:hypothetical protein
LVLFGKTPLDMARSSRQNEVVELLEAAGAKSSEELK